jgi:hypothetical protein
MQLHLDWTPLSKWLSLHNDQCFHKFVKKFKYNWSSTYTRVHIVVRFSLNLINTDYTDNIRCFNLAWCMPRVIWYLLVNLSHGWANEQYIYNWLHQLLTLCACACLQRRTFPLLSHPQRNVFIEILVRLTKLEIMGESPNPIT